MTDRSARIETFLAANGFADARRQPLAGDASARRYERLHGSRSAVLMDCPPAKLPVRPFLDVQARLSALGFSVPGILAADIAHGFVLLEDLGDLSFNRAIAAGADEERLYDAAVDLLADLQRSTDPTGLPPYDVARFMVELELLVTYSPRDLPSAAADDYRALWRELLDSAFVGPACFVYVDYHADNLHWLDDRAGHRRIGLLDFQDARCGPPAYDLVSLLEDARRDVSPDLRERMIERYHVRRPDLDGPAFRTSFAILGAQRNSKICGLFRRLAFEEGKDRYLDLLPRVEAHLRRDLEHPALTDLRPWYEAHVLRT